MVFTGKPSAGCENCRNSKKRCDLRIPCSRCLRLDKPCGGFRDVSDLMFKNETSTVTQKHAARGGAEAAQISFSPSDETTRETEGRGKSFFFDQFITPAHLSFLDDVSPNDFLLKPIMACALATMANRDNNDKGRNLARQYYIEAITSISAALQHPQRVKDDNTLVSVYLLSIFERLSWDSSAPSSGSWQHHIEGASKVLLFRGPSQLKTKAGTSLFRELRDNIVLNAMINEEEVPEYLIQWTEQLENDPLHIPTDELATLASTMASIRADLTATSTPGQQLADSAIVLDKKLVDWAERTSAAGSAVSFYKVHDPNPLHPWNDTTRVYGTLQAHRYWNMWRCLRIVVCRLHEAIRTRAQPGLLPPSQSVSGTESFEDVRKRMADDICTAAADAFGDRHAMSPPKGAVSNAYLIMIPLFIAGTCRLEQMTAPMVGTGERRIIMVDKPLHQDLFEPASTQLAWIIDQLDHIAHRIGIGFAGQMSRFLKGDSGLCYDLDSSRLLTKDELPSNFHGDSASVGRVVDFTGVES